MNCINITTQAEYDAHKNDPDACLHINAGSVEAYGSASVEASGSASVEASGSASVRAYDSASVRAYGSASVEAYGSASVRAYGSASVRASGSASVEASGSASVRAYGSASVEAYDSASVRASGSASVEASGSASVRAYDSAKVSAGACVPVQTFPGYTGVITGGITIKIPDTQTCDPAEWAAYYGLDITGGKVTVYKAVGEDLKSGHGMAYPVGATVTAPDWKDNRACGQGLHFGPNPWLAATYLVTEAKRFLACQVDAAAMIPLGNKIKAESCVVLHEVDIDGDQLPATEAAVPA
jgi:hypothetical protein